MLSMASSSRRPKAWPILSRARVCGLSTITCDDLFKPFTSLGSTVMRNKGASRSSLVTGNMVIDGCSLNKSDWITRPGRGFPKSPCKAIVTRSPRLTFVPQRGNPIRLYQPQQPTSPAFHPRARRRSMQAIDDGILRRIRRDAYPAPKFEPAAIQPPVMRLDACVPAPVWSISCALSNW